MGFGAWWLTIKARREVISTLLIGALLFGAGWQLGRVMSPYYASHPIVFEDKPCAAAVSSGGSPSDLNALADAGIALRSSSAPKVAAAVTVAPEASAKSTQGQFVGSKNSNKYHDLRCSTWKSIKESNRVWFKTREEAEARGYQPTDCTKDKLGI